MKFIIFILLIAFSMQGCRLRTPRNDNSLRDVSKFTISTEELTHAVSENRSKVKEFATIAEIAKQLGIRVWLFGGTAAGFGHYVKWDLLRQKGDTRYHPKRFDYYYWSIFRSTQDADIVVDGTPEQAAEFERLIGEKFAYLKGAKAAWEVRLLKQDRNGKEALLNNPDFLNQHTDSNSVGMIELSEPPTKDESIIRDLRDWNNQQDPFFLRDIRDGVLHYYYSDKHKTTKRYLNNENPEIFSVIRYFTKAFQYELEIPPEEYIILKEMVDRWEPQKDLATWATYAKSWLEQKGNGAKMFKHAVDVEYAWNILEKIGLRQKLISISDSKQEKSLGWWMSKEPLRSFDVGTGDGKTFEDLGITIVAHETSDFLAYESLTRNTKNEPNVFISREEQVGEAAAHGKGFYAMVGRKGAKGTGFTIRYIPNPKARQGKDFTYLPDLQYVIFHNRKAFTVVYEDMQVTWPQFLEIVSNTNNVELMQDKGVLEKLKFRLVFSEISSEEQREAEKIIEGILNGENWSVPVNNFEHFINPALREWFNRKQLSEKDLTLLRTLVEKAKGKGVKVTVAGSIIKQIFSNPGWENHPELVFSFLDLTADWPSDPQFIAQNYIMMLYEDQSGAWVKQAAKIRAFIQSETFQKGTFEGRAPLFLREAWLNEVKTLDLVLAIPRYAATIAKDSTKHLFADAPAHFRRVVEHLMPRLDQDNKIAVVSGLLYRNTHKTNPFSHDETLDMFKKVVARTDREVDDVAIEKFLSLVDNDLLFNRNHLYILEYLFERNTEKTARKLQSRATAVLLSMKFQGAADPESHFPMVYRAFAEAFQYLSPSEIEDRFHLEIFSVMSHFVFKKYPKFLEIALSNRVVAGVLLGNHAIVEYLILERPELIERLLARPELIVIESFISILESPNSEKHPEWALKLMAVDKKNWDYGADKPLEKIKGVDHSDRVRLGWTDRLNQALEMPHWKDHPVLKAAVISNACKKVYDVSNRITSN